jgi:ABC-type sugar transport system substrate-binding protein
MAGIPVIVMDTEANSDYVSFFHSFDAIEKGRIVGEAMAELAEAEDLDLHVYELFCPMAVDT